MPVNGHFTAAYPGKSMATLESNIEVIQKPFKTTEFAVILFISLFTWKKQIK